jgi:preprotein translocase subunit SecG
MTVLPLLAVGILMKFVAVLFILVSIVLILLVLVQKGKGGGLSAAFGGGMASGLLGSKTGDFLTWATITVAAVFLVLAVILARFYRPSTGAYGTVQTPTPATQPAESEAPTPVTPTPANETPTEQPGKATTGAETAPAQPSEEPPAGTGPGAGAGPGADANSSG